MEEDESRPSRPRPLAQVEDARRRHRGLERGAGEAVVEQLLHRHGERAEERDHVARPESPELPAQGEERQEVAEAAHVHIGGGREIEGLQEAGQIAQGVAELFPRCSIGRGA
jgi:hypothetical protein